jgi:predicted O-methyltransferase YrrM
MPAHIFTQDVFDKFKAVDDWICNSLLPPDSGLESALKANKASDLDAIDVAPNQGKLLYLLAKMNNAKRILEIGTLGGYSAIWMAKALPKDGKLITCELEPEHARIAQSNVQNAGLEKIVEIKLGPAIQTLEKMGAQEGGVEKFDMVFIDADKENNVGYLKWALEFSRKGTLIIVDNVVRRGRVVDTEIKDAAIVGVRNLFEMMKKEKRIDSTAVQTVGSKGWDGFAMALVIE